eukprot:CAMPEP_0117047176 /NCGR_PEP_ID=MMETSP0472-20121206/32610_1 /TAXON_ID=693140 ORGANISM="Tiarina fusus, Strain LIS" /NCGR_SAMPLE_ID=MMETSP0472 /ASSEMBLY_ACC=CAM_ASM_000603 /LENGTH=73 /DNA_ID=CAMNT_0004759791 /DNA_START=213 /DNA_END=434 /DNA_ORIENTATION=-
MVDEESDLTNAMDNFISGNGTLESLLQSDIERANEQYLKEEQGVVVEKGIYDDDGGYENGFEVEMNSVEESEE